MVSVGDKHARRFERTLDGRDFIGRRDCAQLVADSERVLGLDQWGTGQDFAPQALKLGVRAGIKTEDRADVGAGRGEQLETDFLGRGKGLFMRQDSAAGEVLQPKAHDKPSPDQVAPFNLKALGK